MYWHSNSSLITVQNGNVLLQKTSTTGKLILGKNVQINATSNNTSPSISFILGEIPTSPTTGIQPTKLTVNESNGGQVYFGDNTFTVKGQNNIINADGGSVIFNNGSTDSQGIEVKGDVQVNSSNIPIAYWSTPTSLPDITEITDPCTKTESANLWKTNSTTVHQNENGDLNLKRGTILVHPKQQIQIKCGDKTVKIEKGSIAEITKQGDSLLIRNLHEKSKQTIEVTINKNHKILLRAGEQAHIGNTPTEDQVGKRATQKHDLPQGKTLTRSEFSLISWMQSSTLWQQSQENTTPESKQLQKHIHKMAACLMVVTGKYGQYNSN